MRFRYFQNPVVPNHVARVDENGAADTRYTDRDDEWTPTWINGDNIARTFPEIENPDNDR